MQQILPPHGFDSQTVQSEASRYTDYAILDHTTKIKKNATMEGRL